MLSHDLQEIVNVVLRKSILGEINRLENPAAPHHVVNEDSDARNPNVAEAFAHREFFQIAHRSDYVDEAILQRRLVYGYSRDVKASVLATFDFQELHERLDVGERIQADFKAIESAVLS